ncbi:MAG: hypothetical protein KGL39_27890 [Patescibacteria group bacterium]|nr:hypothetical protein [Patescibacteria group bacterium]
MITILFFVGWAAAMLVVYRFGITVGELREEIREIREAGKKGTADDADSRRCE